MRVFGIFAVFAFATGCENAAQDAVWEGPDCGVTVSSTYPVDGSTDVYYRTPVEFSLSVADPTASVVTDTPGVQVISEDGLTVRFIPDYGFEPDADHSIGLDYCGGEPEIGFSTSMHGAEFVIDPTDLEGQVWSIDMLQARYPEGSGYSEVIGSLFDRNVLLGVVSADTDSLALRLSLAESDDVSQDECFRTVDLGKTVILDGPDFAYSAGQFGFGAYASEMELMDVQSSGTISPDGTTVSGFAFYSEIDVREVAAVLGLSADVEDICRMAENVGTPCFSCVTDGAQSCIALEAEQAYGFDASRDGLVQVVESNAVSGCEQ